MSILVISSCGGGKTEPKPGPVGFDKIKVESSLTVEKAKRKKQTTPDPTKYDKIIAVIVHYGKDDRIDDDKQPPIHSLRILHEDQDFYISRTFEPEYPDKWELEETVKKGVGFKVTAAEFAIKACVPTRLSFKVLYELHKGTGSINSVRIRAYDAEGEPIGYFDVNTE